MPRRYGWTQSTFDIGTLIRCLEGGEGEIVGGPMDVPMDDGDIVAWLIRWNLMTTSMTARGCTDPGWFDERLLEVR